MGAMYKYHEEKYMKTLSIASIHEDGNATRHNSATTDFFKE